MMRVLFVLIIWSIGVFQCAFALDFDRLCESLGFTEAESGGKYLYYDVQTLPLVVLIADGDSICDVYISRRYDEHMMMTCPKTPLLQWAFDEIPSDIEHAEYAVNNDFSLIPFEIGVIEGGRKIFIESNNKRIEGGEDLCFKIHELQREMIELLLDLLYYETYLDLYKE